MAQVYDTEEEIERVILVGVQLDDDEDAESSLEELKELAKTAGAETVGKVIQPRDSFHPAMNCHQHNLKILKMSLTLKLWIELWLSLTFLRHMQQQVKVKYRLKWLS